jgi:hypothetical protein
MLLHRLPYIFRETMTHLLGPARQRDQQGPHCEFWPAYYFFICISICSGIKSWDTPYTCPSHMHAHVCPIFVSSGHNKMFHVKGLSAVFHLMTCIFLHWSWKHSASLLVYIIADSFLHNVISVFEGYHQLEDLMWWGAAYYHRRPLADSESHKMVHLPPLWSFWFNMAHDNYVLWCIHQFWSLNPQPVVHDSVMLPVETFEMRKHLVTLSLAKPREKAKAILKTCIVTYITLLIHVVKMY